MKKNLFKSASVLLAAASLCSFVTTGQAAAEKIANQAERETLVHNRATFAPVVTLQVWQGSSANERYAFLIGFVNMLELEKEWQGAHPVPFKHSLVHTWVRGLDGMTINDMYQDIENHIKGNPSDMSRPVIRVLWDDLVQPKVAGMMPPADISKKKSAGKKTGMKK